jgi:septal ring factor EnvC (AmiA/AmiB activator)
MATVIRGTLLIALVGVLVSGAVALAVSEIKIGVLNEDLTECRQSIDENEENINEIQQSLSGMEADMRWIVNTLDRIDRRLEEQ